MELLVRTLVKAQPGAKVQTTILEPRSGVASGMAAVPLTESKRRADTRRKSLANHTTAVTKDIPLSPLDLYMGHFITGGVHFFLTPPHIERLTDALAAALHLYPYFDACLVGEANRLALHCGNTGVYLSVYRSEMNCPDFWSGDPLFAATTPSDDGFPWLQSLPASHSPTHAVPVEYSSAADEEAPAYLRVAEPSAKYSSFDAVAPPLSLQQPSSDNPNSVISYTLNSGAPVADFRLVLFRDRRCAIVFRHVHSLGDGASTFRFLQNWSRIYRGQSPAPSGMFGRTDISRLADGDGVQPSGKLNILRIADSRPDAVATLMDNTTRAPTLAPSANKAGRGSIRIEIAASTLENFVTSCRMQTTFRLSSSDVLHALAWKCFALAQHCEDSLSGRIHTLFNLRNIEGLGIPGDYEGSAVLGRSATASYLDLRRLDVARLASIFKHQIKPVSVPDVRQDIAYLAREYAIGNIDPSGHYTRFVIEAWLDCQAERGLIVNDLRSLADIDLRFEDTPARMEILAAADINMVFFYPNDDGTITIHYVGERATLPSFAHHLRNILGVASSHSQPQPPAR